MGSEDGDGGVAGIGKEWEGALDVIVMRWGMGNEREAGRYGGKEVVGRGGGGDSGCEWIQQGLLAI